jgi:hypothetical protein
VARRARTATGLVAVLAALVIVAAAVTALPPAVGAAAPLRHVSRTASSSAADTSSPAAAIVVVIAGTVRPVPHPTRPHPSSSAALHRSPEHAFRATPLADQPTTLLIVLVVPARGPRAPPCGAAATDRFAVAGGDPVNEGDPSGECQWYIPGCPLINAAGDVLGLIRSSAESALVGALEPQIATTKSQLTTALASECARSTLAEYVSQRTPSGSSSQELGNLFDRTPDYIIASLSGTPWAILSVGVVLINTRYGQLFLGLMAGGARPGGVFAARGGWIFDSLAPSESAVHNFADGWGANGELYLGSTVGLSVSLNWGGIPHWGWKNWSVELGLGLGSGENAGAYLSGLVELPESGLTWGTQW